MPRYEPDVGLTRLETVRVSRAAADQRRGRAGRTEPGVCYRLWDEPQTASLEAYARPEILAADLSGMLLDLAQWGAADPGKLAFLDPPPAGALTEAQGAAHRARRHRRARAASPTRAASCAALPLPPRLARMVVDAAAEGAGQRAADIAAILSERGLGGNDVDLGAPARSVPPRPLAPRRGCAADGEALGRRSPAAARPSKVASIVGLARSCRSPIPTASPRAAARTARSCWPTAAAPTSIRPRRWRASRSSPWPRLSGTAAQSRILLAAPITLDEIEQRFADRIERREDIAFDAASASLRGRRSERLGAIALAERPFPVDAGRRGRAEAGRRHRRGSASTGCRGPSRCGNGATA